MPDVQTIRARLVAAARRTTRVAHEAEDLAHDILVATLRRGLAIDDESVTRSAQGAARRHGAFLARSAARRRAREAWAAGIDASSEWGCLDTHAAEGEPVGAPLSVLSPALETTLLLLIQGLNQAELRCALGVSPAALRKRFQALRDRGPLARPGSLGADRAPGPPRLRRSQIELIARLASAASASPRTGRVLGVTDPDGGGLIVAEVLTLGRVTATAEASTASRPTPTPGTPCSTQKSRTSPSSS